MIADAHGVEVMTNAVAKTPRPSKSEKAAGVVEKAEKKEKEWGDDEGIVGGVADERVRREKIGEEELIQGEGERVEAELAGATRVARRTDAVKITVVSSFEASSIGQALVTLII